MRLELLGIKKDAPELLEFRATWKAATARENVILTMNPGNQKLSALQEYTIDLFCGIETDPLPEVLTSRFPTQMEFEALVRGRQIALANALNKGQISTYTPEKTDAFHSGN